MTSQKPKWFLTEENASVWENQEKNIIVENISTKTPDVLYKALEQNPDALLQKMWSDIIDRRKEDLSKISAEEQFQVIASRCLELLPAEDFLQKLKKSKETKQPLKIKFWIDPTWSEIHLWHALPMILLNRLQRMWHEIVFIIWDFTAKIWDPTGRVSSRPILTDEQIKENFSTYQDQIKPFFDFSESAILYNWDWLNKIQLNSFVETLSKVPVSSILQREDFKKRLEEWSWLTMAEIIYPIVMALDSVHLDKEMNWCDVEMWGKDQFLNMQMCRRLMQNNWTNVESIITTDILEWTNWDGRKMSKSYNNYVALTHEPDEIYGKIMSIPDHLMEKYFKSLTEITNDERNYLKTLMDTGKFNPMFVKKMLSRIIVSILHNSDEAIKAESNFNQKFSKKDYGNLESIEKVDIHSDIMLVDFLVEKKIASSKSNARELIKWWGVQIIQEWKENKKIIDLASSFSQIASLINNPEFILKIGKKNIFKIHTIE